MNKHETEIEKIKRAPKQDIEEGVGAKFHRTYSITFKSSREAALQAMRKLQEDPNKFSPKLLATFDKLDGAPKRLQKNDHFQIYISGPWNGPVRVEEVREDGFRFVTLEGHLEAGEITFSVVQHDERHYRFVIESYARSKDYLVDLAYDKIPVAKFAQTEMWRNFCQAFAQTALECQGYKGSDISNLMSEVEVITERRDEKTGEWAKL